MKVPSRCLPPAVIIAGLLVAHTLAAQAPAANDPDGPGPSAWVDDLSPIGPADWSYQRAAHLIERAGFGATPDEIRRFAAMTPQRAVDSLVDYEAIDNRDLRPFDESRIWDAASASAGRRQVLLQPDCERHRDAAARPLVGEPHAHDQAPSRREADAVLARTLRERRKQGGREVLELFTMGVGNYTERDVREAARAFTGWTNDVLAFRFDASQHDFGEKTFLGRTGTFNGDQIIDIILQQPVTGEFVAAKLYRYFVREDVSGSVRSELGRAFREGHYRLKPLLKRIFLSKDFYSPPSYATQIKSPVQLVVSTYKKMGLREVPTIPDFGRMTAGLGQALFDPPNVAGWPGGRTWITPSTLLQRGNLFRDVLFPDVKGFRPPDRTMSATDERVGQRLAQGMNITEATREGDAESNMMVDRDEEYNTRYGGYAGAVLAFKRTKLIPRRPVAIELTAMVKAANADTVDKVVDHFIHRFLRVTLAEKDRSVLVAFLRGKLGTSSIRPGGRLEEHLRELLYLVLSTPEYQLS
jgi:uncharacterized protein (DUF1800 family)